MNKEEFIKLRIQNTLDTIRLKNELKELTKEYIETCKEFTIGQKVIVTDDRKNEEFGFVSSIYKGSDGDLEYKFWKMKKDGSPSQHQLWAWRGYTVRAFNPTEQ